MDNDPTTASDNNNNNRGLNKDIMGNIRAYYIQIFGQKSPREEWDNIYNLTTKDRLLGEGLSITVKEMVNRKKNKKSIYNSKP